jgi:L-fuconolactonase
MTLNRRQFLAASSTAALAGCVGLVQPKSAGTDLPADAIVDAHVHLYDPVAQSHPWLDAVPAIRKPIGPADYRTAAAGAPIAKIVCIEAAPVPDQSLREARWLREAAARDPLIGAIIAQAMVERGDAVRAELEQLVQVGKVTGIRRILGAPFQTDPDIALKPSVAEGVRALARHDLVFDLAGMGPANLDKGIALVRRCPDTRFVLNHTGRPPIQAGEMQPWSRQIRELAAMPNVSLKISNLPRDAGGEWSVRTIRPLVETAINAFGFDRVMFGTDFPVVTLVPRGSIAGSVALMQELLAQASADERRKFFRDNALRTYRIS